MHESHFSAALDIAKRYHLEDEYYVLLRKALIVHKGIYGISLMESARVYFERIRNQKELAKVLCNLAAELLIHGDMEQARSNYQHSAEILRSFGAETIYVPINGLGDYWCLRGDFEQALPLFEEAYREEYDAFTRIAIRRLPTESSGITTPQRSGWRRRKRFQTAGMPRNTRSCFRISSSARRCFSMTEDSWRRPTRFS